MTAGQADPEVQPLAARPQAVLAALDGRRQLADGDLVEVGARRRWSRHAPRRRGTGEVGVDELDGHCPFADGGGAAFGRAGADVTGREHAGDVGLEQVVGVRGGAGEDEAVVVAADGVVEPLGARQRAEEEEQEREGKALAARRA